MTGNKNTKSLTSTKNNFDVICLSHLRWNFVYQRPQHLLSRFAENGRVFFFEEPVFIDGETHLAVESDDGNLFVAVPHISRADQESRPVAEIERTLLDEMIASHDVKDFLLWFYTPTAMNFAAHLQPSATIFDCMDELSAFKFAPPELVENEKKLMDKADLVFTGGQSLYEAKKDKHPHVFAFPSSIDVEHFKKSRDIADEPADQSKIPQPRLGYCGVIDERMDTVLLAEMADLRPAWQFVMIGPVVKIAPEDLPRRSNIHYLGGKKYEELPNYLAGWRVALMPFALNESTKFISPTKTPEYLAAGLPVISTPIRDVARPYGELGLVEIASTAEEFVAAADAILSRGNSDDWQAKADEFLSQMSWDKTFSEMSALVGDVIENRAAKHAA